MTSSDEMSYSNVNLTKLCDDLKAKLYHSGSPSSGGGGGATFDTPGNLTSFEVVTCFDGGDTDPSMLDDISGDVAVDLSSFDTQQLVARIYVPILFGFTLLVGIVGNGLVVFVIAKQCSFKVGTRNVILHL